MKRPNVLFVIADEWRAQALGYAGDPNAQTPSLDGFAAESIHFTEAISGCSVCCPARASLITGQYPLTNGIYINDVPLEPNAQTLGEAFLEAGYRTGYIGKWHLYGSPLGRNERREDYIPREKRFGFEYWKAGECTHDYNNSFYYEGEDRTKKYWDGYDAEEQTEDARRYIIDRVRAEEPYFLVLSWGPPHFPLHTAPERYQAMYRDREISVRDNVPAELRNTAIDELRGYYAHIAALDACFKRLLEVLEETGSTADTIVVFTSDHGDMMRSQGLLHKLYPWEESIRIPLLVRYPGLFGPSGSNDPSPISITDLMPTLLGLAEIPIPPGVQGIDFSHRPGGKRSSSPTSAFLTLPVPITTARTFGIGEYRGIRTRQHTYVRAIDGPWLLYDNISDPYQMHNLCNSPQAAKVQDALETELRRWLDYLGDEFLPASTYLERDELSHYLEPQFPVGNMISPWGDWKSTLPKPGGSQLSADSLLSDLLAIPAAKTILLESVPQLASYPNLDGLEVVSVRLMCELKMLDVSAADLDSLNATLRSLRPEN